MWIQLTTGSHNAGGKNSEKCKERETKGHANSVKIKLPFLPRAAGLLSKNQVSITKGKITFETPNISTFQLENSLSQDYGISSQSFDN